MKKYLLARLCAAALVLALAASLAGCNLGGSGGTPNQWYVAPTGDDSNDCQSATTPCRTIGAAVQKALLGDAIHLAPGTYVENLSVNKSLTFIGAGQDQTFIDGSHGAASFTASVTIDGSGANGLSVTFENLAIVHGTAHAGGGIHAGDTGLTLMNVMISDNTWVDSGLPNQYGVTVSVAR